MRSQSIAPLMASKPVSTEGSNGRTSSCCVDEFAPGLGDLNLRCEEFRFTLRLEAALVRL
jgi:hypothetical protein